MIGFELGLELTAGIDFGGEPEPWGCCCVFLPEEGVPSWCPFVDGPVSVWHEL